MTASGSYLEFESFPELELALGSLENRSLKEPAEVCAVRAIQRGEEVVQLATVYMPDRAIDSFTGKLQSYVDEETPTGKPKNRNLVDRIAEIRMATVESLWTEESVPFPEPSEVRWWEVWLRRDVDNDDAELERFTTLCERANIEVGPRRLAFPDRTVVLALGTADQLANGLGALDDLAELRAPRQPADFFARLPPAEQAEWIDDLLGRTQYPEEDDDVPSVCILDTGTRRAHPLLVRSLAVGDVHTVDPSWLSADHDGHGTEMAGLALYASSLADLLASSNPVYLGHVLESVKILPPPPGSNPPDMYAAVTAMGVNLAEIQAPTRRRAITLAVTAASPSSSGASSVGASPPPAGQPTSWSAALDVLVAGRDVLTSDEGVTYLDGGDPRDGRLVIVSAGNVDPSNWTVPHLNRCDVEPVEDPGQAWNAITVGAYTDLIDTGPLIGHQPVAPPGELSPFSRTSVAFDRAWPLKPDIVMEGGNLAESPSGDLDNPETMQLLTTHGGSGSRLLTVSNATSAATAQASHLAATLWTEYPDLWPETVRALLVHGARWTDRMEKHFASTKNKTQREALVRRYGMGVPSMERVLHSATNELVVVHEDTIHPFQDGDLNEIHLTSLPWPREELAALGEVEVSLRVTLSYFVEPNPSRRGWKGRFRYPSHGLRFELKLPTETTEAFEKRLNKQALDEGEKKPIGSDSTEWFLGPTMRNHGSIHTDIWSGTAADLASRDSVAVYPVTGWWKEIKGRDRSDLGCPYALVMSIEAPDVLLDLYTPVQQQIATTIDVAGD